MLFVYEPVHLPVHECMLALVLACTGVSRPRAIYYTYIWTERIRIFVIISVILDEFSYGRAQIPYRFL